MKVLTRHQRVVHPEVFHYCSTRIPEVFGHVPHKNPKSQQHWHGEFYQYCLPGQETHHLLAD